ncbi:MAG: hypothetical protein ABSB96_11590 [Gaiellaceae bacterium]
MYKPLRRPSPAMVVASIALFVALSGASVAVVNALPKNSVGTKQLKNNAVVSSKVKNGSLMAVDFASGQLPKGAKGDTGAAGAAGANAATNIVVHSANSANIAVGSDGVLAVPCDAGERLIGGGFGTYPKVVPDISRPHGGPPATEWQVRMTNNSANPEYFTAYAVCVSP